MARVFLPVRRREHELIYEHREVPGMRRWEFHAAAIATDATTPLIPTGVVDLDSLALSQCEEARAKLPLIGAALQGVNLMDEMDIARALDGSDDAAVGEGPFLLTATLYLQFARQTMVHRAAVSRYQDQGPEARFDLNLSASIYDSLLKRHDLETAETLIGADIPAAPDTERQPREWAYLLGLAATVKQRLGKDDDALDFLGLAVAAWPTGALWRRIGNNREAIGDRTGAIDAFVASNALSPLEARPALRLAWWYFETGQMEDADKWARTAQAKGEPDAGKLLQRMEPDS